MWIVDGSGFLGHFETGQALPLRNAGASRNFGASVVVVTVVAVAGE